MWAGNVVKFRGRRAGTGGRGTRDGLRYDDTMPTTMDGKLKRWRFRNGADRNDNDQSHDESIRELVQQLQLPQLVGVLLSQRGLTNPSQADRFLQPQLTHLHDPSLLPGVDHAAQRLEEAVRQKQRIVIYGDYDVDGITASAVLWHTLHMAVGAAEAGGKIDTFVPHRIDDGYGLKQSVGRGTGPVV